MQLNITDGAGHLLASQDFSTSWGDSISVPALITGLPYDIVVDMTETIPITRKARAKRHAEYLEMLRRDPLCCGGTTPVDPFEKWEIGITAGTTTWNSGDTDSSTMPFCRVGGWDNGNFEDWLLSVLSLGDIQELPNRQMDCYWTC